MLYTAATASVSRSLPLRPIHLGMTLTVNGETRQAADGATIADLLIEMKLEKAPCAVEVNRRVVPKASHAQTTLADGDQVEIVTLVGGG